MQMAVFLHTPEAGLLSRLELREELLARMEINMSELLAESNNPMWTTVSSVRTATRPAGKQSKPVTASSSSSFLSNSSSSRAGRPPPVQQSSNNPCYSTMLHSWGKAPNACRNAACRSEHTLTKFSKAVLTEHASRLKGVYADAVRSHIASL